MAGFAVGWIVTGSILGGIIFAAVAYFKVYLPYFAHGESASERHEWSEGFKQLKEKFDARRELSQIEGLLKQRGEDEQASKPVYKRTKRPRPARVRPTPPKSDLPDNRRPVIERSRFGW